MFRLNNLEIAADIYYCGMSPTTARGRLLRLHEYETTADNSRSGGLP